MCYECDRYSDYTDKVNFYYAFQLVASLDVSTDREFTVGELIAINDGVYNVIRVQDINDADGEKVARAVTVGKLGAFENPES